MTPSAAAPFRAFLASELDARARECAGVVADALRERPGGDGVSWLRRSAYHITLRFLGDIAPQRVAPLVEGVASEVAPVPPFELRLGALGALPSLRRPRVVMLALEPQAPLEALAKAVERGVARAGFEPESRRFRGHLTLGRVRRAAPPLEDPPLSKETEFSVDEVVLFRSDLRSSGALHTPLERMPLGVS